MANQPCGFVTGVPAILLRIEGAGLLGASAYLYHVAHGPWIWFGALFFAPDLFMLGYVKGPRVGAFTYNLAHVTTVYLLLAALGQALANSWLVWVGLIGLAHIGLDRMLGFGLKYASGFKDTHLSSPGGLSA